MTHTDLQDIQTHINFDSRSMALCLGIDYEEYRRLYYGHKKITPQVERAAKELEQVNRQFMAEAPARIESRIAKEFPCGIMSDLTCE